jgi:hypothetical protein
MGTIISSPHMQDIQLFMTTNPLLRPPGTMSAIAYHVKKCDEDSSQRVSQHVQLMAADGPLRTQSSANITLHPKL